MNSLSGSAVVGTGIEQIGVNIVSTQIAGRLDFSKQIRVSRNKTDLFPANT